MPAFTKAMPGLRYIALLLLGIPGAYAQPAQVPLSELRARNRFETIHELMPVSGPSLIGPQWRAAGTVAYRYEQYPFSMQLGGSVRWGALGRYAPDTDEWYDWARLVQFVRVDTESFHMRAGPLRDTELGFGHVVNFYDTRVAWDARTVGLAGQWDTRSVTLQAFTSDVRLNGVTGGRLGLRVRQRVSLGGNVTTHDAADMSTWSVDGQVRVFELGGVVFAPYISYATLREHSEGLAFGADLHSDGFLDIVSFRLRSGLFYNSRGFIPGYIGALYSVHSPVADVATAYDPPAPTPTAGIQLNNARGSNDLLTDIYLQFGRSFALRHYWRRHFGAQPLSELHVRLFVRYGPHFELQVSTDRHGEHGFFGVFGPFSDLSALTFDLRLRIAGPLLLQAQARYSFEELPESNYYLVQRRFEPLVGMKVNL